MYSTVTFNHLITFGAFLLSPHINKKKTIPLKVLKPTASAEVSVFEPSRETSKLVKAHKPSQSVWVFKKPEPDVKKASPQTEEGKTFTKILPTI